LLREKETLQRQLSIEIAKSYTVTREDVIDETDYSQLKPIKLHFGSHADAKRFMSETAKARCKECGHVMNSLMSPCPNCGKPMNVETVSPPTLKAYVDWKNCAVAHLHRPGIMCSVCNHYGDWPA
jgi:predicted Zn-ribbon and HTH transcriptional regulator